MEERGARSSVSVLQRLEHFREDRGKEKGKKRKVRYI